MNYLQLVRTVNLLLVLVGSFWFPELIVLFPFIALFHVFMRNREIELVYCMINSFIVFRSIWLFHRHSDFGRDELFEVLPTEVATSAWQLVLLAFVFFLPLGFLKYDSFKGLITKHERLFFVIVGIYTAVSIFQYAVLAQGIMGVSGVNYIKKLFPDALILFLIINFQKQNKLKWHIMALLYVTISFLAGSKGGVFRYTLAFLILNPSILNFFSFKRIVVGVFIILTMVVGYTLGQQIRKVKKSQIEEVSYNSELMVQNVNSIAARILIVDGYLTSKKLTETEKKILEEDWEYSFLNLVVPFARFKDVMTLGKKISFHVSGHKIDHVHEGALGIFGMTNVLSRNQIPYIMSVSFMYLFLFLISSSFAGSDGKKILSFGFYYYLFYLLVGGNLDRFMALVVTFIVITIFVIFISKLQFKR